MPKYFSGKGDEGETSLRGDLRVLKDDIRIEVIGDVDEANSAIGFARSLGLGSFLDSVFERVQRELFDLGADLALVDRDKQRLTDKNVEKLELDINELAKSLPKISKFIVPSGTPSISSLHVARTIVRRAERHTISMNRKFPMNYAIMYLNRLSSLLYVATRFLAVKQEIVERKWNSREQDRGL
jgi:cob(I)alamin adenosyltransferase